MELATMMILRIPMIIDAGWMIITMSLLNNDNNNQYSRTMSSLNWPEAMTFTKVVFPAC